MMFYVEIFYTCLLWIIRRRGVYFLLIYYNCVIRFNRNRALHTARVQTGMKLGTLNRAMMLEHRVQHLTEMPGTCWNILSNNTNMDICFSNNVANTNTQQRVHFVSPFQCLILRVHNFLCHVPVLDGTHTILLVHPP